jgi:decaprenylphospho-beta-D-ribofuranose 2-oxidase
MAVLMRQAVTGWGRTNPTFCDLVAVAGDRDSVAATLAGATARGLLARGLGRSYGDSAQNSGGTLIRLAGSADQIQLDRPTGTALVGGGVSIDDLLRKVVPLGWFVPVSPGTRLVTIGGAIASDIHGKNHHVDGSFGNHVLSITLLTADGSSVVISPDDDPEAFWATVGGMGLTGVILDARIRLLPIETSRCIVETTRLNDLDSLLATMSAGDEHFRYSVSWIDLIARGKHLGRSVLTRGDHAKLGEIDAGDADPLAYDPKQRLRVPPLVPAAGVVNHLSVAVFNEAWFRHHPVHRVGGIETIPGFFHPLDGVGSWNLVYGRSGFVQYQFVVPFGEEAALRTVIEKISASGAASFLAVLKRFGPGNQSPLSFPKAGWTLTVDLPVRSTALAALLHELDTIVLDAGGRHYLAKDSHTTPLAIRRGYPRLAEWQAVRDRLDPDGMFCSDQARRLELMTPTTARSRK